jgi:iron complex transport system substrate-binding protein
MTKRLCIYGVLAALLAGIIAPGALPAHAQATESLVVLALESAREPLEAWAAAFASATEGGAALQLEFADTAAEIAARAPEAAVIVTDAYEEVPPVTFECGYISDVFMLLPGLGARYLAGNSCGGALDPRDALARDFLRFVTGPDGQQVAIDLGLLPAAVEIVDQSGMTVRVPQPVRRIASPYSIATYYVYGVGAADRLVVAGYLGARDPEGKAGMLKLDPNFEAIANAVSTLNQQEANLEELAALQPDLILASTRTGWLDAAGALGVPIIRFEGESPQALQDAMTLLGAALGPHATYQAAKSNAYYRDTLEAILAQTQIIADPLRVYFSGTEPLRVASGDMYQTDMVEAAGAVSVTADLIGYWNDVNLEQVALWNPDVIFYVPYGGASAEAFTGAAEWSAIRAVSEGRIYRLPKLAAPWDTPVPDSILGIIWMAQTLYPGQVNLDCAAETMTFYRLFYGYAMGEEEAQSLCK